MKKTSNVISIVFILICAYVFFAASAFPEGSNGALGPGFFPMVLSVIGIFLSILQIFISQQDKSEEQIGLTLFSKENSNIWISLGITIIYFILMNFIGFVICTPIYLLGLLTLFKVKSLWIRTLVPTITTGSIYVVFTMLLYVQLPSGNLFQ